MTGDQSFIYQQNLTGRSLGVVALTSVEKDDLPAIIIAVENAAPGSFQIIECGAFSRKRETVLDLEKDQGGDRKK